MWQIRGYVLYVLSLGIRIACPLLAGEDTFQPLYVLSYSTLLPVLGAVNCFARTVRTELQRSIVSTRRSTVLSLPVVQGRSPRPCT